MLQTVITCELQSLLSVIPNYLETREEDTKGTLKTKKSLTESSLTVGTASDITECIIKTQIIFSCRDYTMLISATSWSFYGWQNILETAKYIVKDLGKKTTSEPIQMHSSILAYSSFQNTFSCLIRSWQKLRSKIVLRKPVNTIFRGEKKYVCKTNIMMHICVYLGKCCCLIKFLCLKLTVGSVIHIIWQIMGQRKSYIRKLDRRLDELVSEKKIRREKCPQKSMEELITAKQYHKFPALVAIRKL